MTRTVGREHVGWDHDAGVSINRSYVYFVREAPRGPIKIGFAKWSPRDRLTDLQVGNPRPLRMIGLVEGTVADERLWHARFAADRIRGEWFKASSLLLAAIAAESISMRGVVLA